MEGKREVLLDGMPGLYAVGDVVLNGRRWYVAASENRGGRLCLVDPTTKKVCEIAGGMGGVMAVVDAGSGDAFLSIEEFYPVFDSATAKIIRVVLEPDGDGYKMKERKQAACVPYVHRIALLHEEDGDYIAAGKLCKHKDNPEDWTTSGTMEIGRYHKEDENIAFERVCDGIFKHHAMMVIKNKEGYDDLYYGGTAGAFRTIKTADGWKTEQLLDVPVSDIVVYDLDGDGQDEIAIIEEFHGDKAVVFQKQEFGYERALELPLTFGHVLWGGMFLGRPGLITGSRGGEKKLMLYRLAKKPTGALCVAEETVIDEGQAPAQIIVNDGIEIVAANHGAAELARYRFGED